MASTSSAAMSPFDRLAQVELQLVMQHCDQTTLLALARCSRTTRAAASHPFAWRSLAPLTLECKSPLELSSRVSASLLRHADLSVRWDMRPDSRGADGHGAERDSEADHQQHAKLAAETVALAALPGLRHLDGYGRSADMARLCAALLARLDHGGALTSLHFYMFDHALPHADGRPLGQLVARSRTLTSIHAEGYFDSDAIRCLADGVQQSQSLAALRLSRSRVDDHGAAALVSAVAHCRSLTDLRLPSCGITDADVEALAAALEQDDSRIRILDLGGNDFGAAGAAVVARLLASTRCLIESLDLSYCAKGEAWAQPLAESLRTNRTLTELRLGECAMGAEGTAALAAALQTNLHIALRCLVLSTNPVDSVVAASLAGFLRVTSAAEELDLGGCGLDDAAVTALAAGLPAARSLRELRLSDSLIGVAGSTALAASIRVCPSLALLDVTNNWAVGDAGLAALAPALTHLRSFDASYCGVTSSSAAILASLLQPSRQLHTLRLYSNAIGSAAVVALAAALQPSSPLRTLALGNCGVDAAAAAALAEALQRGWAGTELDLSGNRCIGDDGARALAAILEQCGGRCSLRTLILIDCEMTAAAGCSALGLVRAAVAVPSLRLLDLRSNRESQTGDRAALLAVYACGAKPHFQLQL